MNLDIEIVAEGLAFPEGPIALSDGCVLCVEIVGGTLKRAWGDGRVEVVATPGGGPNGAQLGPDGAVYVCNNGGLDMVNYCHADSPGAEGRIERIDLSTGKVERVYDRCGDHMLSAPNDLVFDAQGGMWFTDLGKNRPRSIAPAALYYCRPDGSQIVEAHYGTLSYNGVGLSPDERTLYVSDTKSARLWRYDLAGPGEFARESAGASRSLVGTAPGDVSFDSLAVTESGQICVATLGEGAISVFTPDGGSSTMAALPDHTVTNIAFGGADMRTAFITLAGSGRLVRCRWPEPGLKLNFAL